MDDYYYYYCKIPALEQLTCFTFLRLLVPFRSLGTVTLFGFRIEFGSSRTSVAGASDTDLSLFVAGLYESMW